MEIQLSHEQNQALEYFNQGKNIFLTGPGGTGKSVLIRKLVENANLRNKEIQVCAMTGCASVLLNCKNSKTIHSWSGIGLGNGAFGSVVDRVVSSKYRSKPWKNIDILIIDEVSMMSKKIFEILDTIGKKVRNRYEIPFGGIQIVFSGDFYQLPPVGQNECPDTSEFCFESDRWKNTFNNIVCLKTIFRQTDVKYTKILNNIRKGIITKKSYAALKERINVKIPDDFIIKPTILLPCRKDADIINKRYLDLISDTPVTYTLKEAVIPVTDEISIISSKIPQEYKLNEFNYLKNNIRADEKLILKKGTQVMCVANIDMDGPHPIVNGSQGVVIDFRDNLPLVQFNDGQKRIIGEHTWPSENVPGMGVKQIPLIHAWAVTIHKSQGMTLECAQIDIGSKIFECGQTYVALSRVKDLNGLYLTDFNPEKIKISRKVQNFYNSLSI